MNPGEGNKDWWFMGWLIQRQISSLLTIGAEVFHATPNEMDGDSSTGFNADWIVDLNEMNHFLFSTGHSMQGPSRIQCYVAYQLTFGPGELRRTIHHGNRHSPKRIGGPSPHIS